MVCRMSCPNVNRYKGSNYTKPETQTPESKAFAEQVQQRVRERELQDAKLFPAAIYPPVNQPGAKDCKTK
jgi:hypothetical protein